MQRKNLTPTQNKVIDFIESRKELVPTLQEIADHIGVKQPTAWYHVNQLVIKGWLNKDPHAHRGIYVAYDAG